VRKGLKERGIDHSRGHAFLAALHDTTTDEITLYEADHPADRSKPRLKAGQGWFRQAGKPDAGRAGAAPAAGRGEATSSRAAATGPKPGPNGRWPAARPSSPRRAGGPPAKAWRAGLPAHLRLEERQDNGFGVLELIMTAPVVVASWISLQYYGSTVAPEAFGAGNKLLHNVVGGIGVVEGNGGTLCAPACLAVGP
jgi:hypothetical protein